MCRKCGTPKWRGDPCLNPDCPTRNSATIRIGTTRERIAVKGHGFHALRDASGLVDSYDAPIHNRHWVSGGR